MFTVGDWQGGEGDNTIPHPFPRPMGLFPDSRVGVMVKHLLLHKSFFGNSGWGCH